MSELRDKLRSAILDAGSKPTSMTIDFFGVQVEVRQPKIGVVMADAEKFKDNVVGGLALMLIQYCYVPGQDEKVFSDEDLDALLELPWGPDMIRAQEAIQKITGLDLQAVAAAKND